jgi:hypothetical protein
MGRQFAQVSVDFFSDSKVIEVGPLARYLFIAGLVVAKRHESDGRVTIAQLRHECSDIGSVEDLANELVGGGLWAREDERTFTITSWLKWNKSKEWVENLRAEKARAGLAGGLKSGESRRAKQVALESGRKLLQRGEATDEPNSKSKTREHKDIAPVAQGLAKLAFDQPVRPTLRIGRDGDEFVAALKIINRVLGSGELPERIEAAIRAGVKVWTIAGLQTAIASLPPAGAAVAYQDDVVSLC